MCVKNWPDDFVALVGYGAEWDFVKLCWSFLTEIWPNIYSPSRITHDLFWFSLAYVKQVVGDVNKAVISIRLVLGPNRGAYDGNFVATWAKFISVTRQSNMKPPIRPKLEIVQNKQNCLFFVYFLFTNEIFFVYNQVWNVTSCIWAKNNKKLKQLLLNDSKPK